MLSLLVSQSRTERDQGIGILCALINNAIMGIGLGMFLPFIPLRLHLMGEGSASIGIHAAASSVGVLVIAPFMSRWLERYGAPKLLFWASVSVSIPVIAMLIIQDYWVWFVARFIIGCGFAVHWVGSEAWVNQAAPEHLRSRILSIYVASLMSGLACGAPLLNTMILESDAPFYALAAIYMAAIIPLIPAWRRSPPFESGGSHASLTVFKLAPVLMTVGFIAGIADGSAFSLLPVFAVGFDLSEQQAVIAITAFLIGAVLLQYPIGWCADQFGRRQTLIGLAVATSVSALLLPQFMNGTLLNWLMIGLFGGVTIGIYTIALGVVGTRFQGPNMAAANAVFILCFEFGTLSGAPVSGLVMEWSGPSGLMWVIGTSAFFVFLAVLARGSGWKTTPSP